MALVIADRVRETTSVVGTGAATLLGAVVGYQTFSVVGNANTTYYCIAGQGTSEWEVGLGTYTASGTTLARTTVLASSNAGALVNFSAGTKDVFVTYPSGKSVNLDGSGLLTASSGLGTGIPTFLATPTSANLAAAVTNETGSGSLVFATSPVLVTPALGTPSSVNLANATNLPLATAVSGILGVPNGGTGLSSLTTSYIPYGNGTGTYSSSAALTYNGTVLKVGSTAALAGTTNPFIASTGATNAYIQNYIFNATAGGSSSADFVAYPDNGLDTSGWADMGVASSTYSDAAYTVTGPNEAYLFGSAPSGASKTGNLVYATDSTGTANSHQWYVGGFAQAKSAWKMQLTSTGLQLANALSISYGGTGQVTANAGFNALAPSQATNSGKYLTTNGTDTSWASVAPAPTLTNDTATATFVYPLFAAATTGTPTTLYTSNAKYLYKPSTGELQAPTHNSTNGITVNSQTMTTSQTIAAGSSGFTVGPFAIAVGAVLTVASGARHVII